MYSASRTDGNCAYALGSGNSKGFYPKAERTSTEEGSLTVSEPTPGTLIAVEPMGTSTFRYQFRYSTRQDAELSKSGRVQGIRWFDRVTGFSGGAVKHSPLAQKVLSWELVPVRGSGVNLITPKCKIAVFGVT